MIWIAIAQLAYIGIGLMVLAIGEWKQLRRGAARMVETER